MKMKKKLLPVFCLVMVSLLLFAAPVSKGSAAAATSASIELSANQFLEGSPVTIRIYDILAAGASFQVYFTYDSSGTDTLEAKSAYANISVQLGTEDDEWVHTMTFPTPTAGAYIRVHVCGSEGSADLGSAQIDAVDPESLLPTDLIITVGVALMIILIILSVVVGLAKRGSRRR